MKKLASSILTPNLALNGFSKGSHLFYRTRKGQLQGIQFQLSKNTDSYFVNLAFHYDFIPAMLSLSKSGSLPLPQFNLLDFMFYGRLEQFQNADYPKEWDLNDDDQKTAMDLENNMRNGVNALNRAAEEWQNPKSLIDALSPKLVEDDYYQRLDTSGRYSGPKPFDIAMNGRWIRPRTDELIYILTLISMHLGLRDLARMYLSLKQTLDVTSPLPFGDLAMKVKD